MAAVTFGLGRRAGVPAVGEHEDASLALGAGLVDGLDDTVVQAGPGGQREAVDDGLGLVAVLGGRERRLDVGVEGHDADVDVVRDGVEEGLGGGLGGVDPALLPMLLLVSNAMMVVRRTCSAAEPASSALESRTASPIETLTSSGSTLALRARRPAPGWCRRRRARRARWTGRRRPPGPPGRSTAAPPRRRRGDPERESSHQMPSIANSIGSTVTLACAIFSRNFGRRPVERRRPLVRPSASKPPVWS